jgi:hypothetical protein
LENGLKGLSVEKRLQMVERSCGGCGSSNWFGGYVLSNRKHKPPQTKGAELLFKRIFETSLSQAIVCFGNFPLIVFVETQLQSQAFAPIARPSCEGVYC